MASGSNTPSAYSLINRRVAFPVAQRYYATIARSGSARDITAVYEIQTMPRKPAPKRDDPEQSKRFIETAEEVGATDDSALERAFKKIIPAKRNSSQKRGQD